MKIDKSNKELWDIDVDVNPLYEIAFMLRINRINKTNDNLEKEGEDLRAAHCTLSDYINTINLHPDFYKEELEISKIILRKYKIEKIKEKHG